MKNTSTANTVAHWALLITLVGCETNSPTTPPTVEEGNASTEMKTSVKVPRIWIDQVANTLAKDLGNKNTRIYRWEGGIVEGWIEFEGENGEPYKSIVEMWATVEDMLNGMKHLPSAEFSGMVIIASDVTPKDQGATDEDDCRQVKVSIKYTITDSSQENSLTFDFAGRVCFQKAPEGELGNYSNIKNGQVLQEMTWSEQSKASRPWLELRVVDPKSPQNLTPK